MTASNAGSGSAKRPNLKTVAELVSEYPFTHDQLRWFIAQARNNGLAASGAIIRMGRRVYIDVDAFDCWINSKRVAA